MKMKFSTIALAALLFVGLSLTSSFAQVGISIGIAPPAIPIYEQPYPPAEGYIWTPGYWAYDTGYYWVPGAWILPPRVGFLWTPGYWGYSGSNYFFNEGYWGPTVGFYGGINYGYGYGGQGYYGGRWVGNTFRYNTAVTRVNTSVIRNTYVNKQVVTNTGSRASLNGPGGTKGKAGQETANGNSAFGHKQGDATTRTTGSQNNAYGKAQSAEARASHAAKSHQTEEAGTPHAHKAKQTKHNGEANNAATSQHSPQHAQVASHRPKGAPTRQAGPGANTHVKGQGAQSDKKKKKPENQ